MNPQKNPVEERKSHETPLEKLEIWLDNNKVLDRLSISARTLARWRKKQIIAFARIEGKIYYRESDVEELFLKYWRNHSNQ